MAMAALLATSADAQPVRRRALLIGINDYTASKLNAERSATAAGRDVSNLDGTINDVELMRDLLESVYGFERGNIVALKNEQATRRGILDALAELAAEARKNDTIFFYYSGHGSQVRNSSSREQDKLDESLVPADARHGAPDVRDKELRRAFNAMLTRGARLTVVIDACHSGSGARGLEGGLRVRAVKPDERDVADASDGPRPEDQGALILSAARDFEPAFEMIDSNGTIRGAFTWALARAIADASRDEPVSQTFQRAEARLGAERPGQVPVMAGLAEVRLRPFLGARADRRARRPVIAVEQVAPNGNYIVQGGWTSGVTVGTELRVPGRNGLRLEVKSLLGVARAEARLVGVTTRNTARLHAGALLEIAAWAPPPGRPLRVWAPHGNDRALVLAKRLRDAAAERGIRWIDDPTDQPPTHVIRWRDGMPELVAGGRTTRGTSPLDGVKRGASLFVQLPVSPKLVHEISGVEGVELTRSPDAADYILAGRLTSAGVQYAFVRPGVSTHTAGGASLPLRTEWTPERPHLLREVLDRLQRVHGWHELQSPPGAEAYYTLGIRRAADRMLVEDGILTGERPYFLVLRAKAPPAVPVFTRYLYVFVIDNAGSSVLLFPRVDSGSVENRLPITDEATKPVENVPPEISLDDEAPFTVTAPYGTDTYFLLSTNEPLTALSSLEWKGGREAVRAPGGGRPQSPLERLLASKLSGKRGASAGEPIRTPPDWSLEKWTFRSTPPRRSQP
jgi:hypothetical protein